MPRLILWRKNRFVKKPSPLKNTVLAENSMDIEAQCPAIRQDGTSTSITVSGSAVSLADGPQGDVQDSVWKMDGQEAPRTPKRGWKPTDMLATPESTTPTKKRKIRHDSENESNTNITSVPFQLTPPGTPIVARVPSTSSDNGIPDGYAKADTIPRRRAYVFPPSKFFPISKGIHISNLGLIPTAASPKPSLIVKLKVPAWYRKNEVPSKKVLTPPTSQNFQLLQISEGSQPSQAPHESKETRLPASKAKKCPTCGGIHTSTCASNMERLDEIDSQVVFLSMYSRVMIHVVNEAIGIPQKTSDESTLFPSLLISPPSSLNMKEEDTNRSMALPATNLHTASKLSLSSLPKNDSAPEDPPMATLHPRIASLLLDLETLLIKARPLMLEAAMREGNLELGEKLRSEIKQDGIPARAGEAEEYLAELRERFHGAWLAQHFENDA